MFIFTETGYQLFRAKGRSILLLCVSALLCACMTFYIGNISSSSSALEQLSVTDPVSARVVNYNGSRWRDLLIIADRFDRLCSLPIHDIDSVSRAMLFQDFGEAIDVLGLTRKEAAGFTSDQGFEYIEGYDGSFFEGEEHVCVITQDCARDFGLALGDRVQMPLYQVLFNSESELMPIDLSTSVDLRVIGIVEADQAGKDYQAGLYMPVRALRAIEEASFSGGTNNVKTKTVFYYNSMSWKLDNSMDLDSFKAGMTERGIYHPSDPSGMSQGLNKVQGNTVICDDEHFIKTAERLGEKRKQYMDFIIPFFLVVILLVTLSILLVLRGARRDMALSVSLGRPKLTVALVHLMACLMAQLPGCVLALLAAGPLTGVSARVALITGGAFMLCGLIGDVAGLVGLLRFDTLRLLVQTE